jgi:hypothetical protein
MPCTIITSTRKILSPNEIGNQGRIPNYSLISLSKSNNSCEEDTSSGDPRDFQAEEDKIFAEAPSSIIHQ